MQGQTREAAQQGVETPKQERGRHSGAQGRPDDRQSGAEAPAPHKRAGRGQHPTGATQQEHTVSRGSPRASQEAGQSAEPGALHSQQRTAGRRGLETSQGAQEVASVSPVARQSHYEGRASSRGLPSSVPARGGPERPRKKQKEPWSQERLEGRGRRKPGTGGDSERENPTREQQGTNERTTKGNSETSPLKTRGNNKQNKTTKAKEGRKRERRGEERKGKDHEESAREGEGGRGKGGTDRDTIDSGGGS